MLLLAARFYVDYALALVMKQRVFILYKYGATENRVFQHILYSSFASCANLAHGCALFLEYIRRARNVQAACAFGRIKCTGQNYKAH